MIVFGHRRSVRGRVVVVTGADTGVGRAVEDAFGPIDDWVNNAC